MTTKPRITILYCTQCSWLLRSAWMAQELLSTFGPDLGEVALIPGTGGVFEIRVDGDLIWERKRDGGFPEAKILKQKVRDIVWPERDLGHSEGPKTEAASFDKLRMTESEAPEKGMPNTALPHGEPVEPRADDSPSSSKRGQ
ncbi:SelT/SelW/SelH family protein [Phyllobacterium sp. 628]|nr:SelT/SelW/SelH family protein [Phyllobacterium sp. 628]